MEVLGYVLLFGVGLVLGTLGGGGAILSVPILVYLFSLDAVMATAYSLFIVGTTSLVGTLLKHQTRMVDVRTGLVFGAPSLLAIFSTRKWLIPALPEVVLRMDSFQITKREFMLGVFAVLMILASLVLISRKEAPSGEGKCYPTGLLVVIGVLTGFLTGLVGAGGGFLIIPVLVYFTPLPFKTAVGTTLLIITVNSLVGFLGDSMNYAVDWRFLLSISGLAIGGIMVGTRVALRLPASGLQKTFGGLTLLMGVWMLLKEIL